jgi:hypothetical protein
VVDPPALFRAGCRWYLTFLSLLGGNMVTQIVSRDTSPRPTELCRVPTVYRIFMARDPNPRFRSRPSTMELLLAKPILVLVLTSHRLMAALSHPKPTPRLLNRLQE